jgi:hypothetical protein
MRRLIFTLLLSCVAFAESTPSIHLTLDVSEAEQALVILHKVANHQSVTDEDWRNIFETVPYQWLKERETSMGRSFTDQDFKQFLLSPEALSKQEQWIHTLARMKQSNMRAVGTRVLAWLPEGATIRARVFPEIKPMHNSFVWSNQQSGPAIFLYLENQFEDQFENTVAHECHHIGLESLKTQQNEVQNTLPRNLKTTLNWLGGFGEGEAMLAASGSDERHPHWESDAITRARWDADMLRFNQDMSKLQAFFQDILDGKFHDDAAVMKTAAPFWGDAQGAWYTVGYEMSVLVEKKYGRRAFTDCLLDQRKLLVLYNQIATEANGKGAKLAVWSPDFMARLKSEDTAVK